MLEHVVMKSGTVYIWCVFHWFLWPLNFFPSLSLSSLPSHPLNMKKAVIGGHLDAFMFLVTSFPSWNYGNKVSEWPKSYSLLQLAARGRSTKPSLFLSGDEGASPLSGDRKKIDDIIAAGYVILPPSWNDTQKLLWIGWKDLGSPFSKLPRELIGMILIRCGSQVSIHWDP